jgi:hypothetical protein
MPPERVEIGGNTLTRGFGFETVDDSADENGPGGHPWTHVAPGFGYPTGWQHPATIWGETRSLGMGVYVAEGPTPVTPGTWGRIKALYGGAAVAP